jgi:hypothetical protein
MSIGMKEDPSMKEQEVLEEQQETPTHSETEAPSASRECEQQEQQGTTIIHVYVVDASPSSLEEEERTIESTLEVAQEEESEPALPPTHSLFTRSRRLGMPLLLLLALCLLTTAVVSGIILVPLLTASASVTIIPASTQISSTTTLILVTGTPHSHPGTPQVAGRLLSPLTLSQEQVVPTTGTGHQQAQTARGAITLYNALPQAQIVPAGTLLVGADGVQVVTTEDASVPAGSLSTNGQVTVDAQALRVGPAGNIRANDIYGACCRADVFAQNPTAFHGGQKAWDFPMVRAQDIDKAVTTLKIGLQESVQAALHTQVQPGETLVTPVSCTPKVTADHAAGDEATQVRVRLDETCTGETYDTQAVQALLTRALTQEAASQVGAGYTLTGEVQVTEVTVTPSRGTDYQHGTLMLHVMGAGTWAYQFSDRQLHHMAQLIAGKSRQEATTLLLEQPGVSQVAMTVSGVEQTSLPTNTGRIRFLVLSRSL